MYYCRPKTLGDVLNVSAPSPSQFSHQRGRLRGTSPRPAARPRAHSIDFGAPKPRRRGRKRRDHVPALTQLQRKRYIPRTIHTTAHLRRGPISPKDALEATAARPADPRGLEPQVKCALCEQGFKVTSLPCRVSFRSVLELRAEWGVPVHKRPTRPSRLYDTVQICRFCGQFFNIYPTPFEEQDPSCLSPTLAAGPTVSGISHHGSHQTRHGSPTYPAPPGGALSRPLSAGSTRRDHSTTAPDHGWSAAGSDRSDTVPPKPVKPLRPLSGARRLFRSMAKALPEPAWVQLPSGLRRQDGDAPLAGLFGSVSRTLRVGARVRALRGSAEADPGEEDDEARWVAGELGSVAKIDAKRGVAGILLDSGVRARVETGAVDVPPSDPRLRRDPGVASEFNLFELVLPGPVPPLAAPVHRMTSADTLSAMSSSVQLLASAVLPSEGEDEPRAIEAPLPMPAEADSAPPPPRSSGAAEAACAAATLTAAATVSAPYVLAAAPVTLRVVVGGAEAVSLPLSTAVDALMQQGAAAGWEARLLAAEAQRLPALHLRRDSHALVVLCARSGRGLRRAAPELLDAAASVTVISAFAGGAGCSGCSGRLRLASPRADCGALAVWELAAEIRRALARGGALTAAGLSQAVGNRCDVGYSLASSPLSDVPLLSSSAEARPAPPLCRLPLCVFVASSDCGPERAVRAAALRTLRNAAPPGVSVVAVLQPRSDAVWAIELGVGAAEAATSYSSLSRALKQRCGQCRLALCPFYPPPGKGNRAGDGAVVVVGSLNEAPKDALAAALRDGTLRAVGGVPLAGTLSIFSFLVRTAQQQWEVSTRDAIRVQALARGRAARRLVGRMRRGLAPAAAGPRLSGEPGREQDDRAAEADPSSAADFAAALSRAAAGGLHLPRSRSLRVVSCADGTRAEGAANKFSPDIRHAEAFAAIWV